MGRQSARMLFKGKDHKGIYMNGKPHKEIVIGAKVRWKQLKSLKIKTVLDVGLENIHGWGASKKGVWVCSTGTSATGYSTFARRLWRASDGEIKEYNSMEVSNDYTFELGIDNDAFVEKYYINTNGQSGRQIQIADFDNMTFEDYGQTYGNRLYWVTPKTNGAISFAKGVHLSNEMVFYAHTKMQTIRADYTSSGTYFNTPYSFRYMDEPTYDSYVMVMVSTTESSYCYSDFGTDQETRSKLYGIRHTKGSADDYSDALIEVVELNPDVDTTGSIDSMETIRTLFSATGLYNITAKGATTARSIFTAAGDKLFFALKDYSTDVEIFYITDLVTGETEAYTGPISLDDIRYDATSGLYVVAGDGCLAVTSDFDNWEVTALNTNWSECMFADNILYFEIAQIYSVDSDAVIP